MPTKGLVYKIISKLGISISSGEYYSISFLAALKRASSGYWKSVVLKYCMYSVLFSTLNYRLIRPYLWRKIGCQVGNKVFIGYSVWLDFNNSHLIKIGNNVHITNMCILLCHKRDLSSYHMGDNSASLPYVKEGIVIEDGVMIGMNTTIMPGVRIGEGAIIGANSLVVGDIPPWVIASGNPAKVLREIDKK